MRLLDLQRDREKFSQMIIEYGENPNNYPDPYEKFFFLARKLAKNKLLSHYETQLVNSEFFKESILICPTLYDVSLRVLSKTLDENFAIYPTFSPFQKSPEIQKSPSKFKNLDLFIPLLTGNLSEENNINGIKFQITESKDYHIIYFNEPKNELEALQEADKYFDEDIDRQYFETYKINTPFKNQKFIPEIKKSEFLGESKNIIQISCENIDGMKILELISDVKLIK